MSDKHFEALLDGQKKKKKKKLYGKLFKMLLTIFLAIIKL